MTFELIIAAIIGVLLLSALIVLLVVTKETRDISSQCGKDYEPPTFYCPYAEKLIICNKIDTSKLDNLSCSPCIHYPKIREEFEDLDPYEIP